MGAIVSEKIYLGSAKPGSGGSAPVIDELNVTPSTSAQLITAPEGTDGYSPVKVAAVTSSIDANIVAGNIKNGVSILGVIGNYTGDAPAHYIEKTVDANGQLTNSSNFINLTGVTSIGNSVLEYAYYNNTLISSINMGNVETLNGSISNMCNGCTGLITVNLSPIKIINTEFALSSIFANCTNLQTANLSSIIKAEDNFLNSAFKNDSNLTTVKINGLNIVSRFSNLGSTSPFIGCTKLESVELGGLTASTFANQTNQLQYLFYSNTGSTAPNGCTVHFPSNFDPSDPDHTFDASTLTGYPTFGGSASYIHVAFDLPATES